MKILVTTPSGKVGSELVRLLQKSKTPFRLAARSPEKTAQAFSGTEVVRFDHADPSTHATALQGITALYLASPGDFPAHPEKQVVDAAKKAGVQRIVKLSVMGIEHTDSPIRQVEKHIEASGLAWTHVRPTWFMQNYSNASADAVRKGQIAEPAADAKTAFIDARDIAEVVSAALTKEGHAGKAYALTGPEALDRAQVAAIFAQELGKPVTYVPLTDEQFRAALKPYLPASYLELLSALYDLVRAGSTAARTDTVKQVLGRAPISFAQFVRDHRSVWI